MAAVRYTVLDTGRNDIHLTRHHWNHRFTETQVHFSLKHDQGLIKFVHFIWIGAIVHAQNLEIGTTSPAHSS